MTQRRSGWHVRPPASIAMRFALLLIVLLVAACGSAPAEDAATPSPPPGPTSAALDAYLTQQFQAHHFQGSALVAWNGTVLLDKGYGMADVSQSIPNIPTTRFRIGSLTKQFTAAAILLLQADGKLHVRDAICDYLPFCPAAWRPITIAQVLTHTSGIPDLPDAAISDYTKPLTSLQLLALIERDPLRSAPGSAFLYSSAGYNVLGVIIERASGEPYAQFLQQRIFGPLGLTATSYDANHPPLPRHATGYSAWGQPAPYLDMSLPFAAGGLASTTDDLYRWDRALAGNTALPSSLAHDLFTPRVTLCPRSSQPCSRTPTTPSYGYGWYIGHDSLGLVQYHIGHLLSYKSLLARYPDHDATIILLSNVEVTNVNALQAGIESILLKASAQR